MPAGTVPPRGGITAGTISIMQGGGVSYNSLQKGFIYSGTTYFLGVQRGSNPDILEWFYGTSADIATYNNPCCKISSTTYNVMVGGTYSSNTQLFAYNGSNYEIRLEQISGTLYASAIAV